jgi:hypothetical protein
MSCRQASERRLFIIINRHHLQSSLIPKHQNRTVKSLSASDSGQKRRQASKVIKNQRLLGQHSRLKTDLAYHLLKHLDSIQISALNMKNETNTSNNIPTDIFLDSSANWTDWNHHFVNKAVTLKLWDIIRDPGRTFRQEPVNPGNQPDLPAGFVARVGDPEYANALTVLKLKREDYKLELAEYKDQERDIEKLKDWVLGSVSKTYTISDCTPTTTIRDWYFNLKGHLYPGEMQDMGIANDQYMKVLNHISEDGNTYSPPSTVQDWNRWIIGWETAMAYGSERKLEQCRSSSVWFLPFFKAMEEQLSQFTIPYTVSKLRKHQRTV